MVTHIPYENEFTAPLGVIKEVERLKQQHTIGRLLNELQMILQKEQQENPTSEATKEFTKNLDLLEKGYKEDIPKIVEDYQKEYQQNFIREKLPKAEEQYKKLVNWTDDVDNPGERLRKAIRELRDKSYEQVQANFKEQWNSAIDELKNGKCYRDQAQTLKNRAEEDFEILKKFKEKVTNWFKELEELYKKAEYLLNTENYKALYAYRLEFGSILHEVRELKKDEIKGQAHYSTPKDHEWLKRVLTKSLWKCCIATYEYFYWQKNWFEITEQEKRAKENYETFKTSRRERFIREAQDVEPVDDCDVSDY